MLSRCEHPEGHNGRTDGRSCPLRKVRTRRALSRQRENWFFDIISEEAGCSFFFDSWEISVVYNGQVGCADEIELIQPPAMQKYVTIWTRKRQKNPKRIYDFFACRSRQITWSIWSRRAWRGCCFFSICTSWPPKTHSMVGSWCVFPFFAHLFWSNKSEPISQDKWKHARGHILVALHIPMMIQTTGSLAAKKLWRGIRKHFDLGWEYNPLPGFSTTIDWD